MEKLSLEMTAAEACLKLRRLTRALTGEVRRGDALADAALDLQGPDPLTAGKLYRLFMRHCALAYAAQKALHVLRALEGLSDQALAQLSPQPFHPLPAAAPRHDLRLCGFDPIVHLDLADLLAQAGYTLLPDPAGAGDRPVLTLWDDAAPTPRHDAQSILITTALEDALCQAGQGPVFCLRKPLRGRDLLALLRYVDTYA